MYVYEYMRSKEKNGLNNDDEGKGRSLFNSVCASWDSHHRLRSNFLSLCATSDALMSRDDGTKTVPQFKTSVAHPDFVEVHENISSLMMSRSVSSNIKTLSMMAVSSFYVITPPAVWHIST